MIRYKIMRINLTRVTISRIRNNHQTFNSPPLQKSVNLQIYQMLNILNREKRSCGLYLLEPFEIEKHYLLAQILSKAFYPHFLHGMMKSRFTMLQRRACGAYFPLMTLKLMNFTHGFSLAPSTSVPVCSMTDTLQHPSNYFFF